MRKWEISNAEKEFERLLAISKFNIVDIKEYQTKTKYLIEKDGLRIRFDFQHENNTIARGKQEFEWLCKQYEMKKLLATMEV